VEENHEFSPDGALWTYQWMRDDAYYERLAVEVKTGRILWQRVCDGSTLLFAGNTGIALDRESFNKPVQLIEASTGTAKATVPLDFQTTNFDGMKATGHPPQLTLDGRHFFIRGFQTRNRSVLFWEAWLEQKWPEIFGVSGEGVLVMESATGRELLRLNNRGHDGCMLAEDGSTLLTLDSEGFGRTSAIRVWDVQPTRAWVWAVGAAVATGFGLLALRWAWRRRKARKTMSKPVSLTSIG
jgi:hypothetical protein